MQISTIIQYLYQIMLLLLGNVTSVDVKRIRDLLIRIQRITSAHEFRWDVRYAQERTNLQSFYEQIRTLQMLPPAPNKAQFIATFRGKATKGNVFYTWEPFLKILFQFVKDFPRGPQLPPHSRFSSNITRMLDMIQRLLNDGAFQK
jgi:hypothetical protein